MIAQPQRTGVTVGYQGVPGSFSSQAMHQWFGQVESRNYPKFEDVFWHCKTAQSTMASSQWKIPQPVPSMTTTI